MPRKLPWVSSALLLPFLLALSSCATTNSHKNKELPEAWSSALSQRGVVSGTGFVSWKTNADNVAASGVLIIEAPERMRLEVQDPVGGTQALLIVNGDRFFWFAADAATNRVGSVKSLSRVTDVALPGAQLIRALSGTPDLTSFSGLGDGEWEKHTPGHYEKIVSGPSDELESWVVEEKKGAWRVYTSYQNYAVRFGLLVPHLIQVELFERGQFKSRLTWRWSDLRFEGAANDTLLQIPSGTFLGKPTRTLR